MPLERETEAEIRERERKKARKREREGGGGRESAERVLPQRTCHRFAPSCFFIFLRAKTNHIPANRVTVRQSALELTCMHNGDNHGAIIEADLALRIACALPPPFLLCFFFFLLKSRLQSHFFSGELWSILVVRPAHSADLRSRLRHVSCAPCVASLEPGPSLARYFARDMLLLTTTARERAWRLLKITGPLIGWLDGDSPIPGVSPWLAPLSWCTVYIVEVQRTSEQLFLRLRNGSYAIMSSSRSSRC